MAKIMRFFKLESRKKRNFCFTVLLPNLNWRWWQRFQLANDFGCSFIGRDSFPKQALVFTCLQYKSFENTGKRRNCWQQAVSHFPTVFSTLLDNFLPISSNLKLSPANFFSLEESKFVIWERVNDSTEIKDQDQAACMCRLILFYTLPQITA